MTTDTRHDILIIGSGPAGLATALGLQQEGIDVCCLGPEIEINPSKPDTRTIALFSGSVEFLKNLNVWEDCSQHATPLKGIRILDNSKRLIRIPETLFQSSELGLEAFGYNIPVTELIKTLHKKLTETSDKSYAPTKAVTALIDQEQSVKATTTEEESYSANLIIGADGKKSISREFAGINTKSWQYPQTAIVCNFSHQYPHDNISNEFHGEAGPCTTVPLEGNNSSLVLVETPEEAERLFQLDNKAFAASLEKRMHHLLGEITDIGVKARFPLSGLTATAFAKNRVALIGEAAHVIPPIGAQGLNLGFRDAATLIEAAANSKHDISSNVQTILNDYNKARKTDVWSRTLAVDLLNRSLIYGFVPVQLIRSAALSAINNFSPLKQLIMKQGIQPDVLLPSLMRPR